MCISDVWDSSRHAIIDFILEDFLKISCFVFPVELQSLSSEFWKVSCCHAADLPSPRSWRIQKKAVDIVHTDGVARDDASAANAVYGGLLGRMIMFITVLIHEQ